MRGRETELQAHGAKTVFVGTGIAAMARSFAETLDGNVELLCDPEARLFAAAGMRRGLWSVLRPSTWGNVWRAFRSGHRQGKVQGKALQQGGVIVFAADGRILHTELDAKSGQLLDLDAVVAAVAGA